MLTTTALPPAALHHAAPALLKALRLFQVGALPECADGRVSAGPIDLAAYLAQPQVQEAVRLAAHRRAERLKREGMEVSWV